MLSQISATNDEDMEEIGRLNSKGRRQNVSGQLSGFWQGKGVCITASGNILSIGNLCFRVFKLQLKVINKKCLLFVQCMSKSIIKLPLH